MKADEIATLGGNAFVYVLTAIQVNEVFQIVELVVAIVTSVVLLLYRLWKWWKEAKKDGKITAEEISQGIKTIKDGVDSVQQVTNKNKKGEEHGKD